MIIFLIDKDIVHYCHLYHKKTCIVILIFLLSISFSGLFSSDLFTNFLHPGSNKMSITGIRGKLTIFSPKSNDYTKKEPLHLRFGDEDYLKLSKYVLYQKGGQTLNEWFSIEINSLTFIKIEGYRNNDTKPIMFSIAYNKDNSAVLFPTNDFKLFGNTYNVLIKNHNFRLDCNSKEVVKNYTDFIKEILWPRIALDELINMENFDYDVQTKTIVIRSQFIVENISKEKFESIKNSIYKEKYMMNNEYATISFCAFDKLKAYDGHFILYNLKLKFFQDGKIKIYSVTLINKKCTVKLKS